jgi:hypothetical protein
MAPVIASNPVPCRSGPEAIAATPERNLRQHGEQRMKAVAGGAALADAARSR